MVWRSKYRRTPNEANFTDTTRRAQILVLALREDKVAADLRISGIVIPVKESTILYSP
jgi:hypothetical protein